jgi:hypothetical protein
MQSEKCFLPPLPLSLSLSLPLSSTQSQVLPKEKKDIRGRIESNRKEEKRRE